MPTAIQISMMTTTTRKAFGLNEQTLASRSPTSIHPRGRKAAAGNVRGGGTVTPRTRDNGYVGGRTLRKALARLEKRQISHGNMKNTAGHTKPGSMAA